MVRGKRTCVCRVRCLALTVTVTPPWPRSHWASPQVSMCNRWSGDGHAVRRAVRTYVPRTLWRRRPSFARPPCRARIGHASSLREAQAKVSRGLGGGGSS